MKVLGTLLLFLGLFPAGCSPSAATAEETIVEFLRAVQDQDLDGLYCLLAGASTARELGDDPAERRANFDAWALARYDAYREGRDTGFVELDEQGLTLVKLFALGKGTYYTHRQNRSLGPDRRIIESQVRFAYPHVDLSGLSPGTTFYVATSPVGRVHPIRIPRGAKEVTVDLLESIRVRWTLVRGGPGERCAGGWTVASAEPVEGSEVTTEITWAF